MEYKIGYTKTGKYIYQDISNGDVKVKENESDNTSILYPYTEWLKIKNSIADYYNPKHPNRLVKVGEDLSEQEVKKEKQQSDTKENTDGFVKIIFVVTIIVLILGLIKSVFFPKKEA